MAAIENHRLPMRAMDVAISVATDVLHLWPTEAGYDIMMGAPDIYPDSQIMALAPEYRIDVMTAGKYEKPSVETQKKWAKSGYKLVEQTYWAYPLKKIPQTWATILWDTLNDQTMEISRSKSKLHSPVFDEIPKNAPWSRGFITGDMEWEEIATMALYPFKTGELMTGPVHYGNKYKEITEVSKIIDTITGHNSELKNLYHVVMMYPHRIKVDGGNNTARIMEKGFVGVWPFGKNGMENNDMAFLDLEDGQVNMLFGENAYAEWIKQRELLVGYYASINRQTIF